MKRFIYWVYVVCLIVLASSCRSLRHAEREPECRRGEEYEIIGYAPNEERRSHTIVGGSFAGH